MNILNVIEAVKKTNKKKKPITIGIVKDDECEANTSNTLAPVLRNKGSKESMREAVEIVSNMDTPALEGHRMKVVLITEGLGNRVNMNYYGPEAIDSAPGVFEGKPAYFDHPSESEDRDIPERRVKAKCGYFKNCMVENINGVRACTGELHFDLSSGGEEAYKKALTALHYKAEFPSLDSEYVGLSINASGDFEKRTVKWEGETVEVNYVTRFASAVSCDIVTQPARGGRFLALVESAAGASTKQKKEDEQMEKDRLKKSLEAARSALKDAVKESDPEKAKKKMAESDKLFDAFFKEATKAAADPGEEEKEVEAADATETEEESTEGGSTESKKGKEGKKKDEEADDGDADEDDDKDSDKVKKMKKEKKESNRIVVKAWAKESKLDLDDHTVEKLSGLSLQEAKAEIASLKAFKESIKREIVKSMELPAANFEKLTESERSEVGSKNNDLFSNCVR